VRAFPYPALLADIGGTNARFVLITGEGSPPSQPVRLSTGGFPSFEAAAAEAIRLGGWPRPRSLLVGAAGAVNGRSAELTNARWTLRHERLLDALDLEQGLLLNDFEVLSLALPHFCAQDLLAIGDGAQEAGARLVIGPGTGLGVAALVEAGGRWLPLPSEGGHVGFPAETEQERAVFARLDTSGQRIQAERVLAGPGLPALHQAVAAVGGLSVPQWDSAAIVTAALSGADVTARAAVHLQIEMIARFAGDMALTFMARGGVFLAGGMLPRIRSLIDPRAFRARFARNDVHADFLRRLPIWLIVAEEPAFVGLAALARRPQAYWLDYENRLWR